MLINYIQAAMRHAKYEILPDDGNFYGEIPEFNGVYANAQILEECREQLEEVLQPKKRDQSLPGCPLLFS